MDLIKDCQGNFIEYINKVFGNNKSGQASYMFSDATRKINVEVSGSNTVVGILPSPDDRVYVAVEGSKDNLSVYFGNCRVVINKNASNTNQMLNNIKVSGNILIGNITQNTSSTSNEYCKIIVFAPKSVTRLWVDADKEATVVSNIRYQDIYVGADNSSKVGLAAKDATITSSTNGKVFCSLFEGELDITADTNSAVITKGTYSKVIVNSTNNATVSTLGDCEGTYNVKANSNSTVKHSGKIGSLLKTTATNGRFEWLQSIEAPLPYQKEIEASLLKLVTKLETGNPDFSFEEMSACDLVVANLLVKMSKSGDVAKAYDEIFPTVVKAKSIFDVLQIPFFEIGVGAKLQPLSEELTALITLISEIGDRVKEVLQFNE